VLDAAQVSGVRLFDEACDLLADPGTNPEYERALVELLVRSLGLDHDAWTDPIRQALGLPLVD
jgi:hypothetical protein